MLLYGLTIRKLDLKVDDELESSKQNVCERFSARRWEVLLANNDKVRKTDMEGVSTEAMIKLAHALKTSGSEGTCMAKALNLSRNEQTSNDLKDSPETIEELFAGIQQCNTLTCVTMCDSGLTADHAVRIGESFDWCNLTHLNLAHNAIGPYGAGRIIGSLHQHKNQTLVYLNLGHNHIGRSCTYDTTTHTACFINDPESHNPVETDKSIKKAFKNNKVWDGRETYKTSEGEILTKKKTGTFWTGHKFADSLAGFLLGKNALQDLDLSQNELTDSVGEKIVQTLYQMSRGKKEASLKQMSLAKNKFNDVVAIKLLLASSRGVAVSKKSTAIRNIKVIVSQPISSVKGSDHSQNMHTMSTVRCL